MYKVNGVPLENTHWFLLDGTQPQLNVTLEHTRVRQAGRHGVLIVPGATAQPAQIQFVLRIARAHRGTLFTLFQSPQLEITHPDKPAMRLYGVLSTASVTNHVGHKDYDDVTFTVEIPSGTWTGDTVTTPFKPAATGGSNISLLAGISAPVQDAVVRFKGRMNRPQLVDAAGSYVLFDGELPAGRYLRFHADTGRAWVTETNTWTGGTEVSGQMDFGGARGVFEITPRYPAGAPADRSGMLQLVQDSFSAGAGVEVRAAPAYLT
ncbi:hypothetical protein [Canibacter oris]|uniref:Uncharacterized protein n=1 Tax=Canibacter oris TaxID=1365628 RepID=A0A840DKP5_9MICO|nr:hypothetical protein [Canibacter oris]MBB4072042.1 hypothetical protein [Canibacter oris]